MSKKWLEDNVWHHFNSKSAEKPLAKEIISSLMMDSTQERRINEHSDELLCIAWDYVLKNPKKYDRTCDDIQIMTMTLKHHEITKQVEGGRLMAKSRNRNRY